EAARARLDGHVLVTDGDVERVAEIGADHRSLEDSRAARRAHRDRNDERVLALVFEAQPADQLVARAERNTQDRAIRGVGHFGRESAWTGRLPMHPERDLPVSGAPLNTAFRQVTGPIPIP